MKKFGSTLLSFGLLVVSLLFCEVLFRAFWKEAPENFIVKRRSDDPIYHHKPGFRLPIPAKRDGVPRVVFLGDSFTYGWGLKDRSFAIPPQTEAYFKKEYSQEIEAVNLGTVSYSPLIELLLVKNIVLDLDPDFVVLLVDESDVQDDAIYSRMAKRNVFGEYQSVSRSNLSYRHWLLNSKIARGAVFLHTTLRGGTDEDYNRRIYEKRPTCKDSKIYCRGHRQSYVHWDEDLSYYQPHYERTLGFLGKINEILGKKKIPFLLVSFPRAPALDTTPYSLPARKRQKLPRTGVLTSRFQPEMESWAKASEVNYLSTYNVVAKHPNISSLYWVDDSHFNEEGCRLMAEAIGQRVKQDMSGRPNLSE